MSAAHQKYQNALEFLNTGQTTPSTSSKGPKENSYGTAMQYLKTKDPPTGKTRLDEYVEKQQAYTGAVEAWRNAKERVIGGFIEEWAS